MTRGRAKNPYARPDARTRAAKARGYPARSVFKLKEIDERFRLFRPAQHVLDLGAAPGSWSLFASERVGKRGRVVAVDIQPIVQQFPDNVAVVEGDVLASGVLSALPFAPYDVVLSDMAPRTTGAKSGDRALSFELFMMALDVAGRLGKPGSSFVGKLLMGEDYPLAQRAIKERYERAKATKPEGTRSSSTEIFLVGTGLIAASRAQKPSL